MKNVFRDYKKVVNEYGNLEELQSLYEALKERETVINEIINSIGNPFRNLKVHDINSRLYEYYEKGLLTYDEMTSKFNWICIDEYEFFQEIEKEDTNYIKREYIGRTSSFCYELVESLEILEFEERNFEYQKINIDESIEYYHATNDFLMLLLNMVKKDDEIILENLLIEAIKDLEKIYQIEIDELEDIEESIQDSLNELQNYFELVEYDLDVIENALKEIQTMLKYIDDYKTEENEYAIVDEYLLCDVDDRVLEKTSDIIEEVERNILSVIHESKGIIALENIHYYHDSTENAYMVETVYSDKNFNTFESYDLYYTIDDIVNNKVINAFHYDLLGRLINLKLEFDY